MLAFLQEYTMPVGIECVHSRIWSVRRPSLAGEPVLDEEALGHDGEAALGEGFLNVIAYVHGGSEPGGGYVYRPCIC